MMYDRTKQTSGRKCIRKGGSMRRKEGTAATEVEEGTTTREEHTKELFTVSREQNTRTGRPTN